MNKKELMTKKLEIENQLKDMEKEEPKNHFFNIGENYLIRTVTFTFLGNLIAVGDKELLLGNASWIADTGRFSNMLKDGVVSQDSSEIEPCNTDIVIGRGAIVDMIPYNHELPTKQK
jgi:hypothetical protein